MTTLLVIQNLLQYLVSFPRTLLYWLYDRVTCAGTGQFRTILGKVLSPHAVGWIYILQRFFCDS